MSIEVEHLQSLNVKLDFKKIKYPQCPDLYLPRNYFMSLFVGLRGSGKTYSACKLIKLYETHGIYLKSKKVDMRTILISPSVLANPCFTALKSLDPKDIIESYSDSLLLGILDDIKNELKETQEYKRKMKIYRQLLKIKDLRELTQEDIFELKGMGYNPPKPPTFPNGVVNFIILDDLVGSTAIFL
jgi:hypothetical protein